MRSSRELPGGSGLLVGSLQALYFLLPAFRQLLHLLLPRIVAFLGGARFRIKLDLLSLGVNRQSTAPAQSQREQARHQFFQEFSFNSSNHWPVLDLTESPHEAEANRARTLAFPGSGVVICSSRWAASTAGPVKWDHSTQPVLGQQHNGFDKRHLARCAAPAPRHQATGPTTSRAGGAIAGRRFHGCEVEKLPAVRAKKAKPRTRGHRTAPYCRHCCPSQAGSGIND